MWSTIHAVLGLQPSNITGWFRNTVHHFCICCKIRKWNPIQMYLFGSVIPFVSKMGQWFHTLALLMPSAFLLSLDSPLVFSIEGLERHRRVHEEKRGAEITWITVINSIVLRYYLHPVMFDKMLSSLIVSLGSTTFLGWSFVLKDMILNQIC